MQCFLKVGPYSMYGIISPAQENVSGKKKDFYLKCLSTKGFQSEASLLSFFFPPAADRHFGVCKRKHPVHLQWLLKRNKNKKNQKLQNANSSSETSSPFQKPGLLFVVWLLWLCLVVTKYCLIASSKSLNKALITMEVLTNLFQAGLPTPAF